MPSRASPKASFWMAISYLWLKNLKTDSC